MSRFVLCALAITLALAPPLAAQQSTSFTIEQGTFNNGGNPAPVLASPGFRMTLDSIGDSIVGPELSSAGYGIGSGFTPTYAPPGEVHNLRFATDVAFATSFTWTPEPSVGTYNTYRGVLGNFTGYGSCFHSDLVAASDTEGAEPTGGAGWFYVVSAENRLAEEGVTGYNSTGTVHPKPNSCNLR